MRAFVASFAALLASAPCTFGLTEFVQAVNAELAAVAQSGDVFSDYQTNQVSTFAPATAGLDFTGVAWDANEAGTLITPQHIIFADHFSRGVGDTVIFTDSSGQPVSRTIDSIVAVASDSRMGVLSAPVPETVQTYSLLTPLGNPQTELSGLRVLVTRGNRGGSNFEVYDTGIIFDNGFEYLRFTSGTQFVGGDSGSPGFILFNGRLVVVSTNHRSITGGGSGPFLSGADLAAALAQAVEDNPGDEVYEVEFVNPVPEPALFALLAGCAVVAPVLFRRNRR